MKKILVTITLILMLVLPFVQASSARQFVHQNTVYSASTSSERIKEIMYDFIENNKLRKAFTQQEADAAAYLKDKLEGIGFDQSQVIVSPFSKEFVIKEATLLQAAQTETRDSQNVMLRLTGATKKRVVIGTSYDSNESESALGSASSVAICLALAEQLKDKDLPYSIDIVFFGGGSEEYAGSGEYISEAGLTHTTLMINVARIGGGNAYIYCDEVKSEIEDKLFEITSDFLLLPQSITLIDFEYVDGYAYTHFGMIGNHSQFMGVGVNTVNIFGGSYGGLSLVGDLKLESMLASADTIESMEESYADCYNAMASTLELLVEVAMDESIPGITEGGRTSLTMYMQGWLGYLICLGLIAIAFVIVFYSGRFYAKKYAHLKKSAASVSVFGDEWNNPR